MSSVHLLTVEMACSGCSGAVERALKRVDGVEQVEIDLAVRLITVAFFSPPIKTQSVKVTASTDKSKIIEAIKKTGKKITSGDN